MVDVHDTHQDLGVIDPIDHPVSARCLALIVSASANRPASASAIPSRTASATSGRDGAGQPPPSRPKITRSGYERPHAVRIDANRSSQISDKWHRALSAQLSMGLSTE